MIQSTPSPRRSTPSIVPAAPPAAPVPSPDHTSDRDAGMLLIPSEFPPGPGGIGNHAFSLAKALQHQGHRVTVFAPADYAAAAAITAFDHQAPFPIQRMARCGAWTYPQRLLELRDLLRLGRFHTVILSGKFPLWLALYLKTCHRELRVLGILHGSEVNLPQRPLRWLTHRAMAACDALVAVSAFTRSLVPAWIRNRRTIMIVPNGIDVDEMSRLGTPQPSVTSRSPTTPVTLAGNPSILTVGNVTRRKGQHRMIQALPAILARFPDAHYHVVGLPTCQPEFQKLATDLNVAAHVTFHGRAATRDDLARYYQAAEQFAITSENQENGDVEGFGIVVLEANFFGLPVIGATGCGIADAIRDGYNGRLVEAADPEQIARAVADLRKDRDGWRARAQSWAANHDWNQIVQLFPLGDEPMEKSGKLKTES